MIDLWMVLQFDYGRTYRRTLGVVKSLPRLKIYVNWYSTKFPNKNVAVACSFNFLGHPVDMFYINRYDNWKFLIIKS